MAVAIRAALGIVSLVLIGGSILLMLFVVLSGVKHSTPLDKTWFLKVDTSSIPGARAVSQWNYFYVCGADNHDCGKPVPALPFGYAWVGSGNEGVPGALTGSHGKGTTSKYYYYMWRFGWVFYIAGLAVDVLAFVAAIASPFSRLASGFSGAILSLAVFLFSLAAALMTVTFVKARNVFRDNGFDASVGKYAFGFTWAAWLCMFLAFILLFLGCAFGGSKDNTTSTAPIITPTVSRGFFRRKRSRRSARGSFVDNESQRRVKEEYA